jgi:hypothetical protein
MKVVRLSALRTGRLYSQEKSLVSQGQVQPEEVNEKSQLPHRESIPPLYGL